MSVYTNCSYQQSLTRIKDKQTEFIDNIYINLVTQR